MAFGVTNLGAVHCDHAVVGNIKVRILKLWCTESSLIPHTVTSINFIMLDAEGHRMFGSVSAMNVDRYLGLLGEGRIYLMCDVLVVPNFTGFVLPHNANKVVLTSDSLILPSPSPVIDVVGVVACVRYEDACGGHGGSGDVVKFSLVDDRGMFECCLGGRLVPRFQRLFRGGYPRLPYLVMQFVRIDYQNGALVVNGVEEVTRFMLNPGLAAVFRLRSRMERRGFARALRRRVSGPQCIVPTRFQFEGVYPPKTLVNIGQAAENGTFVVCARICGLDMIDTEDYVVCSCCRELVLQDGRYFCSFCRVYSFGVVSRLKLGLEVTDGVSTIGLRMFDHLLGGFRALNYSVLGTGYALSSRGLNILKSRWVLLIVRKEPVDFTHPFFQVVALTDSVEAIDRFKRDHSLFVPAALALAAPSSFDPLSALSLTLDDFANVESSPLADGAGDGEVVEAGDGHGV